MNQGALVSVIVPVYNVEPYLRQCIESLLAQTYPCLEILLIDDGSTDQSGAICDEYSCGDERIRVLHQPNAGVASARNAGLNMAQGMYLAFVDSDDWVDPEMVEQLVSFLERNCAELVICGHIRHWEHGGEERRVFEWLDGEISQEPALYYLLQRNLYEGYLFNKLFSRSLLLRAGGGELLLLDTDVHICEDLLYICRCMLCVEKVHYLPRALLHYRQRPGSALASYGEKRETELIARERMISLLSPVSPRLSSLSKARYVDAAVNLVRFAARTGERQRLPRLRKLVKTYYGEYMHTCHVAKRDKVRAFLIYRFPWLSDRVWLALKKVFHVSWDR